MKALEKPREIIAWFEDLSKEDTSIVGGKNANLGELISIGVPVPPGFAITAYAFKRFLDEAGIKGQIYRTLEEVKDTRKPEQFEAASRSVRKLIESTPIPPDIADAIRDAYKRLCDLAGKGDLPVAVRSSATAEDLPDASFAGQQETFLNVIGGADLVEKVRRCWSSLFTPRAIFYRVEKGFVHEKVLISVGVQEMVDSRSAGVIFTLDPVHGDRKKIVIESNWGLGESLVSGAANPDRFGVDKESLEITEREVASKKVQHLGNARTGEVVKSSVQVDLQNVPSLGDQEIRYLAELARKIEAHYSRAQDIEFAVDRNLPFPDNMFVVQSRPETVWALKATREIEIPARKVTERAMVLKGFAASPGVHGGKARVVLSPQDASKVMRKDDILVTKMTNPDWVPYMKLAGAIVTDDGGITCHAAIVSRELGIPCIVGAKEATKLIRTDDEYTVDARSGVVYEGIVQELLAAAPAPITPSATFQMPVTATKIYVNLSMPEIADKVAGETKADGVGLLRAEHMMLSVGKHPRLLMEEGGESKMIEEFADGVRKVAKAFYPGPVVYRFLDFKPDEFLGLPGGEKYEREAGHVGPNPLIGYRGCFRYIKEPDVFRLECRAIRKVREEYGLTNVWVMFPFVRTIEEFENAKKIMEEEGLRRSPDFKLWIMVEVPSTCFLIDKFIEKGIDGISFGTNDLTMLILGIDRDDASIQEIYDERNLAVLRAMSHVIRTCREHGVTTSICGQAPSNYPEVVEFLVREGASSMSVNPDKVVETRLMVAGIERKMILDVSRRSSRKKTGELFTPNWATESK